MAIDTEGIEALVRRVFEEDSLPRALDWVERLRPVHQKLFFAELYSSAQKAAFARDWQPVQELLEDWAATAEVDADIELAKHLSRDRDARRLRKQHQDDEPWPQR